MKKLWLGLILLSLLISFIIPPTYAGNVTITGQEEALLQKILTASGARLHELNLEGWVQISNNTLSKAQLALIIQDAAKRMGFQVRKLEYRQESRLQALIVIAKPCPQAEIQIAVQSHHGLPGPPGSYLVIHVREKASFQRLLAWHRSLAKTLAFYGKNGRIAVRLTGTIDGHIPYTTRGEIVKRLFQVARAGIVEGVDLPVLTSFSGYTPAVNQIIPVAGRKVNLNIALRYHSSDGLTYLHAGIPLLDGQY